MVQNNPAQAFAPTVVRHNLRYSNMKLYEVNCKIATSTYKEYKIPPLDVWYTKALDVANIAEGNFEGIDGFLIEFTALKDGIIIGSKITSFEQVNLPDSLFKIPEGNKMINMDSLMPPAG